MKLRSGKVLEHIEEKINDNSNDHLYMKLRFGKEVYKSNVLPEELKSEIPNAIEYYKSLFGSDEYARDLLELISQANKRNIRYEVNSKIDEMYNDPNMRTDLLTAAAMLGKLILGSSNVYKDGTVKKVYGNTLGQKMLEEFDNSVSVIGVVERISDMNIDME